MIYNYSENTGINFKLYMIFDIINWLLSLFFLHFDLSTIRNRGKKIYNKIGFNFSILFPLPWRHDNFATRQRFVDRSSRVFSSGFRAINYIVWRNRLARIAKRCPIIGTLSKRLNKYATLDRRENKK